MNFNYNSEIKLNGLRFGRIIRLNEEFILIGSKLYEKKSNIDKYTLYLYKLNENFEIIKNSETLLNLENIVNDHLTDLYTSLWLRDFYQENESFNLLIDFNKNIENKSFQSNTYLVKTSDFITFEFIKKYKENHIIHKTMGKNIFMSKYTSGEDNWGRYLFEFKINNELFKPQFGDNVVNYGKDKGHLVNNIQYDSTNECYRILFSILNQDKQYNIYIGKTMDFIKYYDIKKIDFNSQKIENDFYCFPCMFEYNNKNFLLTNQMDFWKFSTPIFFREESESLNFIEKNYNVNFKVSNKLLFNENKKYIFYDELENKCGNRYNEIIEKNKNLSDYSTHSPSCIKLYDLLKKLNITKNDSIIDIGSGKGWALTIFNLFDFKKISGIEISERDYNISHNNLELLKINNIELINDDIINFNNYDEYNYFYFYNPFNATLFENVIKNIKKYKTKIIYNNIHDEELKILEKYNFKLINEEDGKDRKYYVFIKEL